MRETTPGSEPGKTQKSRPLETPVAVKTRHIWTISLPIIIAGVSETVIDVTDAIFLGRYGVTELGAVALADTIYQMVIVVTVGLTTALQIVVSHRTGEQDTDQIGRTFVQGLYLLTLAAAALFVAIKFGSPWLTGSIIQSDAIRIAVDSFLAIYAFNVFFDALNFAYSSFYIGISRTRVLVGATVVLASVNVALDYTLIFGHFGLPRMGIRGAALASLAAEIATCAFLTAYVLFRGDAARYGLYRFRKWNRRLTRLIIGVSTPVVLEQLVENGRWFVLFLIIEQLGEVALAGSNIVYSSYVVLLIPIEGFSEAVCTMVGNLIGQGRSAKIGLLIRKAMTLTFVVALPCVVLALLQPERVLSIFTTDRLTITSSISSLMVVAVAILLAAAGDNLLNALVGTGDTKATFAIEVVVTVVVLIWAYWAAVKLGLPLQYVWMTLIIEWLVRGTTSYALLRGQFWKRLRI